MDSSCLARQLKSHRTGLGRSLRRQAHLAGIDHATLLRWESGESKPSYQSLVRLVQTFSLDEDQTRSLLALADPQLSEQWTGSTIRALRLSKGLSQELLAEVLQVQQSTVSKWEHGLCQPSGEQLRQIRSQLTQSDSSVLHEQLIVLRSQIAKYDLADCFQSYGNFWHTCSTHSVEFGEFWGVELTARVKQIAMTAPEAKKLLGWIYSSRAYWLLVRGRHSEVMELAVKAIQCGIESGFDFTTGYAFWAAARVHFTKNSLSKHDRLALKRLSDMTQHRLAETNLPFSNLVRSSYLLHEGDVVGATKMLFELRLSQFECVDEGQFGQSGQSYWEPVLTSYHKLYALRAKDYQRALEFQPTVVESEPIPCLLNKIYDLAALTKLTHQNLASEYKGLLQEADARNSGYAFSTMESHVKRITGIDLQARCLS